MTTLPCLIIGHRGAAGHYPENTLASFAGALEMGVGAIELDVHLSKDGVPMVIHDAGLQRTTGTRGTVRRYNAAELQRFDAGNGEKIPELHEVIALVNRRVPINIELKGKDTALPVLALLEQFLTKGWQREDFLLSSFDHNMLLELKNAGSPFPIAALLEHTRRIPWDFITGTLGAHAVNPPFTKATPAFIAEAHERGLLVYSWTVNQPEDMRNLIALSVDGIFTDYPDKLRQVLTEYSL